jgi:glucose-6-phosphate-specific signal transduction histidine kinase
MLPVQRAAPRSVNLPKARLNVWRDLAVVILLAVFAGWAGARLELFERLFDWSRTWERYEIDELLVVMVALCVGMTWFAARRYRDASHEIERRNEAQERLTDALAEQRRLAQRYVSLQEGERKALARELHDELGQYLNAIKLEAVTIRDEHPAGAPQREAAVSIIQNADHVYRAVGILIRRLRPVGLDELGLAAAIEHSVDGARARSPATRFSLAIDGDVDKLGETCDLIVYRLVQEGLTNCAKHARASEVDIHLARRNGGGGDRIALTFTDDGAGANWAERKDGLGLVGMRERVQALGGDLHVTTAPGYGFRFVASFPLPEVRP